MVANTTLFPIFLKLTGRTVVLVGAGTVAASKLDTLTAAGAKIRVIAPVINKDIERSCDSIVRRPFKAEDLDGAWLVIAAATPEVNRQVAEAAEARGIFVNAVDDPTNASAYLGGVVRRAGITFAISTDGRAPALAGILRQGLETMLPETELEQWLSDAERLRHKWQEDQVPIVERRPNLLEAITKHYLETKNLKQ